MMNFKDKRAQTAVELAVFGTILIFVMGLIIRSTHAKGMQQHTFLRATRFAMGLSHMSTETKKVAARNSATVLIMEDRLTAASSKYGAIDRMPLMNQGSAIHSVNLFMPIDFGDNDDLPRMDMFVNGKRFVFTFGNYKTVELAVNCAGASSCSDDCADETGKPDCSLTSPEYQRGADVKFPDTPGADYWEDNCVGGRVITTTTLSCADTSEVPPDRDPPYPGAVWECPDLSCTDCSNLSEQEYQTKTETMHTVGCAKLYTIVDNHHLIDAWCDGVSLGKGCSPPDPDWPAPCSAAISKGCNLSADERFDLDREDLDGDLIDRSVPLLEREHFAWQWFLVNGIDESWDGSGHVPGSSRLNSAPGAPVVTSFAKLRAAEGIILPGTENDPKNVALDVDYDLKQEYIMSNIEDGPQPNKIGRFGVITQLGVQDPHEGDLDLTYNDSDRIILEKLQFGFTRDTNLYTFVRSGGAGGGTYLQIDEGDLYGSGKQYIRTASKKDQVDLIERGFLVSNQTGRYCGAEGYGDTTPTNWGTNGNTYIDPDTGIEYENITEGEFNDGLINPVEVCSVAAGECFSTGNIHRTCMDVPNKIIFIRSRIQDYHGRKWVTDESGDPYLDFTMN